MTFPGSAVKVNNSPYLYKRSGFRVKNSAQKTQNTRGALLGNIKSHGITRAEEHSLMRLEVV